MYGTKILFFFSDLYRARMFHERSNNKDAKTSKFGGVPSFHILFLPSISSEQETKINLLERLDDFAFTL